MDPTNLGDPEGAGDVEGHTASPAEGGSPEPYGPQPLRPTTLQLCLYMVAAGLMTLL